MHKPVRLIVLSAVSAWVILLTGCGPSGPVTLALAPPGPADLGAAAGLSTPPPGAAVFDLEYLPQRGGADDLQYNSFWGFGGPDNEAKNDSFLSDVRKKAGKLYNVYNPSFTGRKWSAIEYHGRQVSALYFDVNGDGKLGDNERIAPTRKIERGFEFITPDFLTPLENGGQTLCRALLQVNFWSGNSEPNCMWSPGAVLSGRATLNGKAARLLLYASGPGRGFDQYGASRYALLLGETNVKPGAYVSREDLSTLISSEGEFYRLTIEGRRSNGLPARALIVKDTAPTGTLSVKLASTNSLRASVPSLYLHGVNDKTVFFRVSAAKEKVTLPVGTYALNNGLLSYGTSNPGDWEVSFTKGPWATIKAGEAFEVALGEPALKVRAVEERNRWDSEAVDCSSFKRGAQIYLEPRIVGKGFEVFSRFREPRVDSGLKADRPPKVTITGPDGKQLVSATMEYG